jgi:DNA-binding transcriptional ArsR family regulator
MLNSEKASYELEDLQLGSRRPRAFLAQSGSARSADLEGHDAPSSAGGKERPAISRIIEGSTNRLRRRERLRDLFREHRQLCRTEVIEAFGVAPGTASRDLRALCDEGLIEKVKPSASPRSHYFRLLQ